MKCMPLTFQWAHFTWLRRSTLSARRAFRSAIMACRFASISPTLLLYMRSAAVAVLAMAYPLLCNSKLSSTGLDVSEQQNVSWKSQEPRSILKDRTGFGDVGVEGFDDRAVLLFDDATLELERKSEAPIVKGEVFGEQSETLDGFVLREMHGEALHLGIDQRVHRGMGGHLLIVGELDSLLGELGGDGHGIRNDEGHDEFAFIADDHGVKNIRTGFESVFDGLRSDEFARGGFQQVFLAIGDVEIVVLVQVADVAGAEPAVFAEHFGGCFRFLVVALHDARTFDENLAVFRDANLDVGDGLAGTADAIVRVVTRNNWRSFRQAIALIDGDADGPKEFGERFGKRRAAGRDDAQAAAGAETNFLVDQRICKLPLDLQDSAGGNSSGAPRDRLLRDFHRPIKKPSLDARVPGTLLDETRVNFFEEARDGSGNGGSNLEKGLGDRIHGFDVGESGALEDVDVVERSAIDVGEREKGERDVLLGIQAEVVAQIGDVRAKIAVREHHAFGLAGSAGSIDERGELTGKNLRGAQTVGGNVRGTCTGDESFVAQALGGSVRPGIRDDDLFELGKFLANVEEPPQLRRTRDKNHFGAAMLQDVGHPVGGLLEVDGNGDAAGAGDSKVRGVPFGAIRGEKTDAIAGLDAELDESGGKSGDAAEKFLRGDRFPAAVAANHLGARVRQLVDDIQEARGKRAVLHGLRVTVLHGVVRAQCDENRRQRK